MPYVVPYIRANRHYLELRAIDVPVLLMTGARSAMLTPAEARARGSRIAHAEVAIVPGSARRTSTGSTSLNDRIAAVAPGATPPAAGGSGPAQPTDNSSSTSRRAASWAGRSVVARFRGVSGGGGASVGLR